MVLNSIDLLFRILKSFTILCFITMLFVAETALGEDSRPRGFFVSAGLEENTFYLLKHDDGVKHYFHIKCYADDRSIAFILNDNHYTRFLKAVINEGRLDSEHFTLVDVELEIVSDDRSDGPLENYSLTYPNLKIQLTTLARITEENIILQLVSFSGTKEIFVGDQPRTKNIDSLIDALTNTWRSFAASVSIPESEIELARIPRTTNTGPEKSDVLTEVRGACIKDREYHKSGVAVGYGLLDLQVSDRKGQIYDVDDLMAAYLSINKDSKIWKPRPLLFRAFLNKKEEVFVAGVQPETGIFRADVLNPEEIVSSDLYRKEPLEQQIDRIMREKNVDKNTAMVIASDEGDERWRRLTEEYPALDLGGARLIGKESKKYLSEIRYIDEIFDSEGLR